jgi:hypothetical protein
MFEIVKKHPGVFHELGVHKYTQFVTVHVCVYVYRFIYLMSL